MDRIFALLSAAMLIVMLSSVALFLMIVDAGARQPAFTPSEPLPLIGLSGKVLPAPGPVPGGDASALGKTGVH